MNRVLLVAYVVFLATTILPGSSWALNPEHYEWLRLNGQCVGCDFSGGDFRREELAGRNMRDSDVSGADLRFAVLRGADLRGASFANSNLAGADLGNALTDGTDFSGAIFCLTIMPDGSDRSDECLEGLWREDNGGVILIGHNPTRQTGVAYKAIVQSGAQSLNVGEVIMQNFVRTSPGVYAVKHYAKLEDEIFWIDTSCVIKGASMACFDGLLRYTLEQARPVQPIKAFHPVFSEDIGAPTNREGPGSR